MSDLTDAARAVVDRWDSPKWKDAEHTGVLIARLREAVAEADAKSAASARRASSSGPEPGPDGFALTQPPKEA